MAPIEFNAYAVHETHRYFSDVMQQMVESHSIALSIGQGAPFPSRCIEAKRVADIKPAFDAYVAAAAATGKPLQLRVRVKVGRSPAGLSDARLVAIVNPPPPKG